RAGPNLVHVPLDEANRTAYSRVDLFGGPEAVIEIARWDAEAGAWRSVVIDGDRIEGEDFEIGANEGLLVRLAKDQLVEITGAELCELPELRDGRNLVAIPCRPQGTTAFAFLASDTAAALRITAIERQVPGVEGEIERASIEGGIASGVDFPITRGEAYWLIASGESTTSPRFRRGDANVSGSIDLTDAITVLTWL